MRRNYVHVWWVMVAMLLATVAQSAPTKATPTNPAEPTLMSLRQEMTNLMTERENALKELNSRYETAALADRVTLEQEGATLLEQYERQYLEILVQYHQLAGNTALVEQAQRMLERLNSEPTAGVPLNLDRNLTPDPAPASTSSEGGVSRDQNLTPVPTPVPSSQEGGVSHER
jgi:hypothetical protein